MFHFSENEESVLDWEGQLRPTNFRKRHAYDQQSVSSVTTYIYSDGVDNVIADSFTSTSLDPPFVYMAEYEANNVASILDSKAEHSKFGASISNMVAGNNYG